MLIVDDDQEFTQLAAALLSDRGYRVVGSAATASEAVGTFSRLRPDAVLVDVRLPDCNGLELAAELCSASARTGVLLTSTDHGAVSDASVRRSGARGFVPKAELARTDLSLFL